MPIKQVEPPQAHEILKSDPNAVYLDVRTEAEFAQGHPSGAINVPVVFIKGPGQMEPNPDFVKVVETNVRGGFGGARDQSGKVVVPGWRDAGLPVSTDLSDSYEALRKKAGV